MATTIGVVQFPGSNCELDVIEAVEALGATAEILWHADADLRGVDAVVIPGGFAHGDYLRPGAIARFSPVMGSVATFAADGGPVVGICNGFQVLTEAHLLPGALQKNAGLKFRCGPAEIRIETVDSVLTSGASVGAVLSIPINHFEGNYTCSPETLAELRLVWPELPVLLVSGHVGRAVGVALPVALLQLQPARRLPAHQRPQPPGQAVGGAARRRQEGQQRRQEGEVGHDRRPHANARSPVPRRSSTYRSPVRFS